MSSPGFAARIALACALALTVAPAAAEAQSTGGPGVKRMEHPSKAPFGHIPQGPLQIIISIDQQKLHLYSDGTHVADTLVATGVPDHPTPLGVFSVIQKSRYHVSNIYSNAPMPYMQRITWSGVAMHEGVGVGRRASHGCIRMPHDFAARLWALTRLGAGVIIAGPELRPQPLADPHLFVHLDKPAATVASEPQPAAPLRMEEAGETAVAAPVVASEDVPKPLPDPAGPALRASTAPIAIFVSRKNAKLYVRQEFVPLFDAPITIENPQQRIGTHIFTALDYLDDRSSFRWNVVSLSGRRAKPAAARDALTRIEIPADVIERISELILPGSSLIVSDQGLDEETGEGTDFIVVMQEVHDEDSSSARFRRRAGYGVDDPRLARIHRSQQTVPPAQ